MSEIRLRDKSNRLTFDLYRSQNTGYSIYLVSEADDWSSNSLIHTMYRHDINYNGWREDQLKNPTSLSQTCGDRIRVSDILIAVACKSNSRMAFLERSTMDMLPSSFELKSTERFYSVEDVSMMENGAKELQY